MFLIFLITNDHVLINYHFVPFVISYFRHFCHFTHLGWLYKLHYKFVTLTFNLSVRSSFCFSFLSSFSTFSPFLCCQTPSKDDNLEDERLKPLPSLSKRLLGVRSYGCWWFPSFSVLWSDHNKFYGAVAGDRKIW